MSANDQPLARLRGEIDTLDDAIHDLIVKRGSVVEEIGRLKAGQRRAGIAAGARGDGAAASGRPPCRDFFRPRQWCVSGAS